VSGQCFFVASLRCLNLVTRWVPKWGEAGKEGEVFVFPNGSFVCWGLGEADARRFAKEVIGPDVEVAALSEAETEEVQFVTDPNELSRIHLLKPLTLVTDT